MSKHRMARCTISPPPFLSYLFVELFHHLANLLLHRLSPPSLIPVGQHFTPLPYVSPTTNPPHHYLSWSLSAAMADIISPVSAADLDSANWKIKSERTKTIEFQIFQLFAFNLSRRLTFTRSSESINCLSKATRSART